VKGVLVASWAMLLDLKAVRIVTTILARDVVAFFAVFACQSNLWTNIVKHGLRAPCQNRTDDLFLTKEVRYHCAKGASLFFKLRISAPR